MRVCAYLDMSVYVVCLDMYVYVYVYVCVFIFMCVYVRACGCARGNEWVTVCARM